MLHDVGSFVAAHPFGVAVFIGYLATAIASFAVRTLHSKQLVAFEARHPVIAGPVHIAFGLLANADQVRRGLFMLVSAFGWKPPADGDGSGPTGSAPVTSASAAASPAAGPPVLHRVNLWTRAAAVACVVFTLSGCASTQTTATVQKDAGVTAITVAGAARVVDEACADFALSVARAGNKARGEAIAGTCAKAYEHTRGELISLGHGLDAWTDGMAGAPACALLDARDAVAAQLDVARGLGAKVPTSVDAALVGVATFAAGTMGGCVRPTAAADGGSDADG